MKRILLLALLSLGSQGFGQSLSLDELLNLKVNIATLTERSSREAPGIISIVTEEDILLNNCRDLVDVINLVPGLNVGKDLDDPAIISRGLYGFEGRTLVMVDGLQISGLYFGSFTMGNVIPVHMINRVEIIRGPGSVIYGGVAELAVVNIITKKESPDTVNDVYLRLGQLPSKLGHQDLGYKREYKSENLSYNVYGFYGKALRSDGKFILFDDRPEIDHDERSAGVTSTFFGFNVNRGDSEAKAVLTNHTDDLLLGLNAADHSNLQEKIKAADKQWEFETAHIDVSHKFTINPDSHIKVGLGYQRSFEWDETDRTDLIITRIKPHLLGFYKDDKKEFLAGIEYFTDNGKLLKDSKDSSERGFRKSREDPLSDTVSVANTAFFTQLTYFWEEFHVSGGVRSDENEIFGGSTNPRLGFNYFKGDFHTKVLYAQAFRAPLIGNNSYNKYGFDSSKAHRLDVKPEKTFVTEVEFGYKILPDLLSTINFYDQTISDVIEFAYMAIGDDGDLYSKNGGKIGTQGAETEIRYLTDKVYALFNVSLFKLTEKEATTYVANPEDSDAEIMGAPSTKVYSSVGYKWGENLRSSLNILHLGEKIRC